MRTRSRKTITLMAPAQAAGSLSASDVDCNGATHNYTYTTGLRASIPCAYIDERIVDDVGRGKANSVLHRKRQFNGSSDPVPYKFGRSDGTGVTTILGFENADILARITEFEADTSWSLAPVGSTLLGNYPNRWNVNMSGLDEVVLKEDCIENARALKADHVLNIAESNQLWPSIRDLVNPFEKMEGQWRNIRKYIRTASGTFLAWKFGVSPILQDAIATIKYSKKFADDVKRFANQDSSRYTKVFRGKAIFNSADRLASYSGRPIEKYSFQGRVNTQPEVRYVLVVKPNQKYQTDLFNKAAVLADRFSSSPTSFAWEKVPFSFVVDWFVDLRGFCRAVDDLLGFSPYQIVSFTRSFKYSVATDGFVDRWSSCPSNDKVYTRTNQHCEFTHYERSPVSPAASWPTWKPRFGKSQAAITAALIGQKLFAKLRA